MAVLLQRWRLALGALALGTAGPVVAVQWGNLAAERDSYRDEVGRLKDQRGRQLQQPERGSDADPAELPVFAGSRLDPVSGLSSASAAEDRLQLSTEAALLRRELATARSELATWDRQDGTLDVVVDTARGSADSQHSDELVDLMGRTDRLRRRLVQSDRDLVEVQVERDEALAQLRREMFSNLLYTTILGECGQRNTTRAVSDCADLVRAQLRPEWSRFESCVRDYNAIPAYTQAGSAQHVSNALRLSRGAVLMCDPGLPEGGSR